MGMDCVFALRGMALLMAQCREHPGVGLPVFPGRGSTSKQLGRAGF